MMAARWLRHLCEGFLALCLLVMVVAVFGNVVLRYVWGTGWVVTEELGPRWRLAKASTWASTW